MNGHWKEIEQTAQSEGLSIEDLVDTILHRTICLNKADWDRTLEESVGNLHWHRAHREHIAKQQYTGANYDPNLDLAEIKKLVAQEIKALGVKASLRRSSGTSLFIDIKEAPFDLEDDQCKLTRQAPWNWPGR